MNRQLYETYVFQVVKCGSLTNAAKELKISQPALSQGLNALEKEIGLKVFNRRTNPITLTPEGEMYYRHICRIEALNENFQKELTCYRQIMDNRVVIGAPAVYVNTVIAAAIKKLDDISISIRTAHLEQLVELAENGKIDCFISTSEDIPEHFQKELLFQEEIVLCVPEDTQGETLEELLQGRLITLESIFPLQQAVDAYLEKKQIWPKKKIIVDQVSEAVNLAEQGIGICFASREATEQKRVRTISVEIEGRNIYLAYDKEFFQTNACRQLIAMLLQNKYKK